MSLNRFDRSVLDTLLPAAADPALPQGIFEAGFDEFYAGFQKTALLSLRFGFRAALFVAAWLAPLLIGKLPPISRLERDDRERALNAMASSRVYVLRQLVLVLKAVTSFCYGANADVRDRVSFPRQHDDPRFPTSAASGTSSVGGGQS